METDYHVTSGHSLYSVYRFRDDVRHMIIYEDLDPAPDNPNKRTRLFSDEDAYQTALRMEKKAIQKNIQYSCLCSSLSEVLPD